MAELTEHEKQEFLRVAKQPPLPRHSPRQLSMEEYMEFLKFASAFTPREKSVSFSGDNWKL